MCLQKFSCLFLLTCEVQRFAAFQIEKEDVAEDYSAVGVSQRCNAVTHNLSVTSQVCTELFIYLFKM